VIDVEERWSGDLWRGDFSCKYVEDITQKTGSFKKFAIFVKMLIQALKQHANQVLAENQEVSVRLMTTADLAEMKAKRGLGNSSLASSAAKVPKTDKRYLILSADGEFEKVHFPLPLIYTEEPDMQTMFKTFQRMNSHLNMNQTVRDDGAGGFDLEVASQRLPNTMQDFFKIEVENESLRSELLEVQSSFTA
jgi:coiled-coil domain-containing protein 61